MSNQLRPENTMIMKELVRKFDNNSLEPLLFERLDSIRLSYSKYLVTAFIEFFIYRQVFASFSELLLIIVTKCARFVK